jgi:DNA (cytosine-5)-methyltransferase 1
MNYLSVCSGIEAATVAWHDLGWNSAAFSEIEKFPSEVLAHHYPSVPNLGDMTKYKEWNLDSIGLLVGGTPCQSFSVAGLRKGLDDPRGNLALTYVGILDKFRPKWCLWENVPGVLSSGEGRDFGSFLGALVKLGYGFAYRVLDAQYFGVPQRRRRVFVVGCSSGWELAAKVLFEPESLSGNTKKSRKERKEIANTLTKSPSSHSGYNPANSEGNAVIVNKAIGALCARDYKGVGSQYVEEGKCIVQPIGFPAGMSGTQCVMADGLSPTLQYANRTGIAIQDISGREKSQNGKGWNENIGYTIDTQGLQGVATNLAVRRLTPIECERLQGFPDNYTNIKESCPDTSRYKALGNSMAVPVMRWIGKRIKIVDQL